MRRFCLVFLAGLLLTGSAVAQESQYKRRGLNAMVLIYDGRADTAVVALHRHLQEYPDDPEFFYGLAVAHTQRGQLDSALVYVEQALEAGLPVSRFLAGPRDLLAPLTATEAFQEAIAPVATEWLHGPLVGDVTDRRARFWVRTWHEVPVQIRLWPVDNPAFVLTSPIVHSQAERDYTAILTVDGLQPSTTYTYELVVDGDAQPERWQVRTFPVAGHPAQFQIGFGGGGGFTPWYERMWNTVAAQNPAAFLLMGDNVYIDNPTRPAVQHYTYYRRQSRPEFQTFAATTPIFAIWDDHDFGENDSFGGPAIDEPAWKRPVWEVYRQNWNNPAYGGGPEQPGVWFTFSIGDVDFFMLDGRYYRTPPGDPSPSMLGDAQLAWLFDALRQSTATFKVLVSPVPWAYGSKTGTQMTPAGRMPGGIDTWEGFQDERAELFGFLDEQQIEGVLLLSADRHRSDLWRIERPDSYDLYEFESSRLTNIHYHEIMPASLFGYNAKPSFGMVTFDTARPDPAVTYQIYSIDGERIYTFTLHRSQLSY